ncbi:hypothetical protein J6590_098148 [Homalodisca vitripennis]|nr:hypothetical protein J6590_098148 [Homalodisca vitripennis]
MDITYSLHYVSFVTLKLSIACTDYYVINVPLYDHAISGTLLLLTMYASLVLRHQCPTL